MNAPPLAADSPLSIVIVDDEPPALRRLRALLAAQPNARVVGEAGSVAETRARLDEHHPDLVLLDIELGCDDAFALLEGGAVRAAIVFVTAHAEHAVRAFECDVLDYLLKPIRPERLSEALARAERWRASRGTPTGTRRGAAALSLWSRKGLRRVAFDEILHIVARDDHSELYLRDGTSHLDATRMESWQQRLPAAFLRTHRSHIVNLDAVVGVCRRGGGWLLELVPAVPLRQDASPREHHGGRRGAELRRLLIPISRGRVAAVRDALHPPGEAAHLPAWRRSVPR